VATETLRHGVLTQGGKEERRQGTKRKERSQKGLFVSIRKLEVAEIGRVRGNSNRGVSIRSAVTSDEWLEAGEVPEHEVAIRHGGRKNDEYLRLENWKLLKLWELFRILIADLRIEI
jgi:hypothetical protein